MFARSRSAKFSLADFGGRNNKRGPTLAGRSGVSRRNIARSMAERLGNSHPRLGLCNQCASDGMSVDQPGAVGAKSLNRGAGNSDAAFGNCSRHSTGRLIHSPESNASYERIADMRRARSELPRLRDAARNGRRRKSIGMGGALRAPPALAANVRSIDQTLCHGTGRGRHSSRRL